MKRCLRCDTTFDEGGWRCPNCDFTPESDGGYPIFAPALSQHNDTYTSEFFANLAQLEKGHFWFEARNRLLVWAVKHYFPHSRRLLEIGCGTGFVLQEFRSHLPAVDLYGSDLLVEGLLFASQRVPTVELIQMDVRDIPYKQEFDVIGAFDVIEHIGEDDLALSQMYNAVKPGGGVIITVPQHRFLWSVVDHLSYHKRRYDRNDLINKVQRAGFQVIKTTSFVSLLLPAMLLKRSRKTQDDENFDLYAEFKLDPFLNAVLSKVMDIEVALIRNSVSFRFGGSRLLIATRPE